MSQQELGASLITVEIPACECLSARPKISRLKWNRIGALLLCIGFSVVPPYLISRHNHVEVDTIDFQQIYYGSRCVLHHQDPYDPNAVLSEFRNTIGATSTKGSSTELHAPILVNIYFPTALFLLAPLAMLPWGVAQAIWIALTFSLLVVAGYLVWSLADDTAPQVAGLQVCLILAGCGHLFILGNPAGVAVSACIIATWCFLRERCVWGAILLLGASLLLKPHDACFIWLFLVLAAGMWRKRALQTLGLTGLMAILSMIWVASSSKNWMQELQRNQAVFSAVGGPCDPSPSGVTSGNINAILDLQAALSLVVHDPRYYNLGSYLIAGSLILIWGFVVLREQPRVERALFAIAGIAPLSLLPVYHRAYDAKILMLSIPACAILWTQRGPRRWLGIAFTLSGILLTSDLPVTLLSAYTKSVSLSADKSVAVSLLPPLAILAMGCFYLWTTCRVAPQSSNIKRKAVEEPETGLWRPSHRIEGGAD